MKPIRNSRTRPPFRLMAAFSLVQALCLIAAASAPAAAHGGVDERLKILVRNDYVLVDVHIPASLLSAFDDDKDGELQIREYQKRHADISAWVDAHLFLVADNESVIAPSFKDEPIEYYPSIGADDHIDDVRVLRRYPVPSASSPLQLVVNFGGSEELLQTYLISRQSGVSAGKADLNNAIIVLQ